MIGFEKVVLITGGAGFIGSNFLNKFVPQKTDTVFVNVDCLTYAGKVENVVVSSANNYHFEKVDIKDKEALEKIFELYQPTAVIHFAAESHVDHSLNKPDVFIETNVLGTNNLLALAVAHNIQRFHHISTDEVYGALDETGVPFTEKDLLYPRNPYSASKAAAEMMVHAYHETFSLNTVITRACNTFGPNQDNSKLIPRFINLLQKNEQVPLYGKGEQMREWLYVEDCVEGIETVFRSGRSGEVYNIGGGLELKNHELTEKLLSAFGRDKSAITYVEDRLGHDFRYAMDIAKIKEELGWSPRFSFTDGLCQTIKSYE